MRGASAGRVDGRRARAAGSRSQALARRPAPRRRLRSIDGVARQCLANRLGVWCSADSHGPKDTRPVPFPPPAKRLCEKALLFTRCGSESTEKLPRKRTVCLQVTPPCGSQRPRISFIRNKYSEILQSLSTAVAKETHAGTLDNICGSLAKMIIVNPTGIPLNQVFPAFLQKLPLREDFQENEAVIKCFYTLYRQGCPVLRQHLADTIKVAVYIYYKGQTSNAETKNTLIEFLKTVNHDFAQEFGAAVSSLGSEATVAIQKLI